LFVSLEGRPCCHHSSGNKTDQLITAREECYQLFFFIFFKIIIFHGFWHAHFFAVPNLAAPTNAFIVDDASTGSTASLVFTHLSSLIKNQWLAVCSAMVCNLTIIELHTRVPQGAMFGSSAFDPFSP